jgi:membrane protease YdiL (CAAX protease family)
MAQPGDTEPPAGPPPTGPDGAGRTPGPDGLAEGPAGLAAGAPTDDRLARLTTAGRAVPFLDLPDAAPATRGDAGVWILLALLGFVIGEIAAALLTVVAADVAGDGSRLSQIAGLAEPPEWYVAASLVGLWAGFVAGPLLASRLRGTGRFLVDLGLRFRWIDLTGVFIGAGGQLLVVTLYAPFIKHIKNFTAPTTKLTGASHGGGFLVVALLTVLGAPFFEELVFRGLLFRGLARLCTSAASGPFARRTVGVTVAVVVDGLLFGLAHGEWVQLAGLAAFGMLLAFVSYRTGRLGMNIVAHGTFNLVAVLVVVANRQAFLH